MFKKGIKAAVLAGVFLIALVVLSLLSNRNRANYTAEMEETTLPIITMEADGTSINRLYGHRSEMEIASMRDTITPLPEDRILPIQILTDEMLVEGIFYELRSVDGQRLIESEMITDFSIENGMIQTSLAFSDLLTENQEYSLDIALTCGQEIIHYYTRLIEESGCYTNEAISFVLDFHEKTFDKDQAGELSTYLESNSEGDNSTLQKVTIHSSLSQVSWGEFTGEVMTEAVPALKEITPYFSTLTLSYVLASTGDNGETEFYDVEEYYRVRYSVDNTRMYLLDYERTMEEIFRGDAAGVSGDSLILGIRGDDVTYRSNEAGTVIGFVQAGELWCYQTESNQFSQVFSFRGMEGFSVREDHDAHEIRLIKVDEDGNMDFVVSGYMNRGLHEGYTGIALYHYNCKANTIEERMFLASDQQDVILNETGCQLFYVGEKDVFYLIADGAICRISLDDGDTTVLESNVGDGMYASSEDGRYLAWTTRDKTSVTVMDLETGFQRTIEAESGEVMTPVGFVSSDFVCTIARENDRIGDALVPYKLEIIDEDGAIVKNYEQSGYYITDAYVEETTVYLEYAWRDGNTLKQRQEDTIKSRELEAAKNVTVSYRNAGKKETQVLLKFSTALSTKTPRVLTPGEAKGNSLRVDSVNPGSTEDYYFVYAKGKILLADTDVTKAIRSADENAGVVIGPGQSLIWSRGKKTSQTEVSSELDRTALAQASAQVESYLRETMPTARVLNLTGLSVSQVLYYVSCGTPVFALGAGGEPILIVGYDAKNTVLVNLPDGAAYKMGINDSTAFFEEGGNFFVAYIP